VRDVIGVSFYTDAHHSIIDKQKLARNEANLNPIRQYLQQVTDYSDAAAHGDAGAASCAMQWLSSWAAGDAMLGDVNHQGEYEREWTLGGLAMAYLKVRDTGASDPDHDKIAAWFSQLATIVETYYPPTGELNNHDYWAGVAVAASGIAANDRSIFDWGIAQYKVGVDAITSEGTLPLEMARGARALHYHLFAIEPLVMIAEMGRANGNDLYLMNGGAIERLAKRCVDGILDPSYFAQQSGFTQDITPGQTLRTDEIAWMEPYQARYPTAAMLNILSRYRPVVYSRLGGNLTKLYSAAKGSAR
jgi:poly(beta-D-mannuronate) lyase